MSTCSVIMVDEGKICYHSVLTGLRLIWVSGVRMAMPPAMAWQMMIRSNGFLWYSGRRENRFTLHLNPGIDRSKRNFGRGKNNWHSCPAPCYGYRHHRGHRRPEKTQDVLGHLDIKSTQIYTSVAMEQKRRTLEATQK